MVKDIMSSAHLARPFRDRLPIVCDGDRALWIPGVAVDDRLRSDPGESSWTAELIELPTSDAHFQNEAPELSEPGAPAAGFHR